MASTLSYGWVGIREDLVDRIAFADQDEFRLFPLLKKVRATALRHTWQTDTIPAGVVTNAFVEGEAVSFSAASARTLVGNYVQGFEKPIQVSSHMQAFLIAGVDNEYAEQLRKGIVQIHKDYEATILRGTSASGASGTAASMSGIGQIAGNTAGSAANRDWDRDSHNSLMATVWSDGGRPDLILAKPTAMLDFMDFPADAAGGSFRVMAKTEGTMCDYVKIIVDAFGQRDLAATNYHATTTATANVGIWYISKKELKAAEAIPLRHVPLDLAIHAKSGYLESIWTLEFGNPDYHATVTAVN